MVVAKSCCQHAVSSVWVTATAPPSLPSLPIAQLRNGDACASTQARNDERSRTNLPVEQNAWLFRALVNPLSQTYSALPNF
jgi:hypothetical protein